MMPVLPIVTYPAKVLSRPARTIKPGDVDLHELFAQMLDSMREYVGVGLAAPQVGKSLRFIVAEDTRTGIKRGYANPRIIESSTERDVGPEGCLSFPGVYGRVVRHKMIRIRYMDLDYQEHEEEIDGFYARVLQHEIDHLNGVLLIDRAEDGLHEVVDEQEEQDIEDGDVEFAEFDDEDDPDYEPVADDLVSSAPWAKAPRADGED